MSENMEDTIREAMKGSALVSDPDPGDEAPEAEIVIEDKPQVGRARDESGKFTKAEQAEEAKPAPATEEKPKRRPPNTWKKEAAAKWDAIDAEIQDEIERRENDIRQGIEQYRGKAQYGEAFEKAIAPYMATLNGFGVAPHDAVGALLATDHNLRYGNAQQKQAAIQKIASDYGIDLSGLAQAPAQIDPNVAALQQRLDQLQGHLSQREQLAQQAEVARLTAQVSEFAKSHPHFEAVRESMGKLIDSGLAKDLDEAYEKALWASPDLRQTLLAEQQEKTRQEASRKTEEARKAAAVNVPVKGTVAPTAAVGSMEDTIRATLKKSAYFN